MKYAFTICSANYLPYAKSVGDSLLLHNPGYRFIIFLLDKYPEADPAYFEPHTIIHAERTGIAGLAEMNERYNIFELSCAFKPFAAEWLFKNYPDSEIAFYFDSDILVFNKLSAAEEMLEAKSIVITPHVTTSLEFESRIYLEKDFLRAGVFNAGFFGLRNDETTSQFLSWWKKRLKDLCYNEVNRGLFVDQLWLNFVPLIFPNAAVLFDPGYNMAYWNMEERKLTERNNIFFVKDDFPLVFFHFSGYDIHSDRNILSRFYPAFTFDSHAEFLPLFQKYRAAVLNNNRDRLFDLLPKMGTVHKKKKKRSLFRKLFLRKDK